MYNLPGTHQQRLGQAAKFLKDILLATAVPSPLPVVYADLNMPRTNLAHNGARKRNTFSQCLFSLLDELFLSHIIAHNILDLCLVNN